VIKLKYEILKKTLLYRLLAFAIGAFITTLFLWHNPFLSLKITVVSEFASIGLYYLFEYLWRRHVEKAKLKKGMNILLMEVNGKISLEYNVLEVLEDNKFVIEVV